MSSVEHPGGTSNLHESNTTCNDAISIRLLDHRPSKGSVLRSPNGCAVIIQLGMYREINLEKVSSGTSDEKTEHLKKNVCPKSTDINLN